MSAMVDFPHSAIPHRKPLPTGATGPVPGHPQISHSHSRTASSNVFPTMSSAASSYPSGPAVEQFIQPTRRTLSNATTSTSSSGERPSHHNHPAYNSPPHHHHQLAPVRTPSALRRSGSGRTTATTSSATHPTSYVALMRKQKATVWSERAQHEDPRLLAAQRQAKLRAAIEVVGGPASHARASTASGSAGGSSGGGLRSKIRHHGATKATTYTGANMAGAGVPMRLSANEVEEGDSEEEAGGAAYHRRTGSGRSSLGSDRRVASGQFLVAPRHGSGTMTTSSSSAAGARHEDDAGGHVHGKTHTGLSLAHTSTSATMSSSSSGGSRENSFGQLAPMAETRAEEREDAARRKAAGPGGKSTTEDLMRRGSVDERSMTMTGVRLFVANPDDDSD